MSDRPEDQQWDDDVGKRRHGKNWIAEDTDQRDWQEIEADADKTHGEYGDERDEAFEADETSEPGSMSPEDAAPHPADTGEPWQVGQRDGQPVIAEGDAENVPIPRKDEE